MADKESRLLTVEEMQKAIIDNPDVPMGVAVKVAQDTRSYKIGFEEGYAKAKEELCQP